jgi:hypothetical protein
MGDGSNARIYPLNIPMDGILTLKVKNYPNPEEVSSRHPPSSGQSHVEQK